MLHLTFSLSDPPTAAEHAVLDLAAQSLENAVDSGWGHGWFRVTDYQWADQDHRAELLPNGQVHYAAATFHETDEDGTPTGVVKRLTPIDMVQAWLRAANDADVLGAHNSGRYLAALQEPGEADFDAEDDDAIVQVAVLGEYRYS